MNAAELLTSCERRGIRLWQEAGNIRATGPKGSIKPRLVDTLKAHKAALLPLLPIAPDADIAALGQEVEAELYQREDAGRKRFITEADMTEAYYAACDGLFPVLDALLALPCGRSTRNPAQTLFDAIVDLQSYEAKQPEWYQAYFVCQGIAGWWRQCKQTASTG